MVANREGMISVGKPLVKLIMEGHGAGSKALELAVKLDRLMQRSGAYVRKYETNEERVLHRHLNLFKNKLAQAKTDEMREHWRGRMREQRQKIAIYEQSQNGTPEPLDLDGL